MFLARTSAHIHTSRTIKGFRACRCSTGISMAHVDQASKVWQQEVLLSRQMRRVWLVGQYRMRPGCTDVTMLDSPTRNSCRSRVSSGATMKEFNP